MLNTLKKLKRESAGYLHEKDDRVLDDLLKNMREFVCKDFNVFTVLKGMHDKREEQLRERKQPAWRLDLTKVKEADLGRARVSRKEWERIKLLTALDADIFKPNDFGVFSPHSLIVDMTKYREPLPLEAKEILYRPPQLKMLYEKYWQLVGVVEGRAKEENDRKTLKEHHPRFPQKSTQELQAVDKILNALDLLIAEDER